MREKLAKLRSVYRRDGFRGFWRKLLAWLRAEVFDALSPAALLRPRHYRRLIRRMLAEGGERIILWRSSFGWQVPLFQRPQHIARALARSGTLVLYEVSRRTDRCLTLRRQEERLWLFNFTNRALNRLLLRELGRDGRPKYVQLYSTDWKLSVRQLERLRARGFGLIYEYVDAISPVLSGTGTLPRNVADKYRYAMRRTDVYVVTTAERLRLDVLARRGARRLIEATNGVDYAYFRGFDPAFRPDAAFQRVLERRAYAAAAGAVPVQRFEDYCARRTGGTGGIHPQIKGLYAPAAVHEIIPLGSIRDAVAEGVYSFGKKLRGFDHPDAVLSGVESRTSSPVRILRDAETLQSPVRGLYPCGEGAGYAGGIMSAAMDGLRVAEQIALRLKM